MRMIDDQEECLGHYKNKSMAETIAIEETRKTNIPHHAFLSHYNCPYDFIDKMFWSVIITRER
jgi:hypothetical protein